jgi:hypothetical protein
MLISTITSIGLYVGDKLAEKLIQDKFTQWTDKFKNPLKEQLTDIIYKTQIEFCSKYPELKRYERGEVPFWGSQILIDGLLEYKYYSKKDFSRILEKLKVNENIVIPTQDQLIVLLSIFISNTEKNERLKELEREIGYKERIFMIDYKID